MEGRTLMSGLSLTAATVPDLIADITAANRAGGANTITLAAKTTSPYILTTVNNGYSGANGLPVIAANDNLTIVGNGDTIERSTAAGTPAFRLFDVAAGASLTLGNVTLQGGWCLDTGSNGWGPNLGGGAIYNGGTLVLNGVTVQHNIAESGYYGGAGGGIYSYGGSVTLEGGTIFQYDAAGGLYNTGASYAYSAGWGGGLYAQNSAVIVTNATLDNNIAGNGAAQGCGGGLYALNSTVTVTNATLDNNTVSGGWGILWGGTYGGGLYAGGGTVTVTNSTLDNNRTSLLYSGGGGGLCLGVAGGPPTTATLDYDTVESNSARFGGGLYVGVGHVNLTCDTVEFNRAFYYGGGLYVHGTVTMQGDTVESNTASAYGGGYGGGIYCSYGTVYLDSITVANTINNTDQSGLNGSTANIDGTYILQNP